MDCKETNQSIQKEINPEHSLDGLMLNLKLQYFGHLMHRASSLEKTLILGEKKGAIEDETVECYHLLNGHEFEQTLERVKERKAWCAAVHEVTKIRYGN